MAHITRIEETPRQKFDRLAEARMESVENALRILGNLANTAIYEYDIDDKTSLFDRLLTQLAQIEKKFNAGLVKQAKLQPPAEQVAAFRAQGRA